MTFPEALELLHDGDIIFRESWQKNHCICLFDSTIFLLKRVLKKVKDSNKIGFYYLNDWIAEKEDFTASDWQIFSEKITA